MQIFSWDIKKNELLINIRGICFEEVVTIFNNDEVLKIYNHPNQVRYPGQKIAVVNIKGYAYLVPYVEEGNEIFFKTIIPSRKATKLFLGDEYEKDNS